MVYLVNIIQGIKTFRVYFSFVLHYLYILWSILCFLSIKLAVGNLKSKFKYIHISMILSEYGTQIFAVMVGYGHFFSSEMSFCTKQ